MKDNRDLQTRKRVSEQGFSTFHSSATLLFVSHYYPTTAAGAAALPHYYILLHSFTTTITTYRITHSLIINNGKKIEKIKTNLSD